MRFRTSPWRKPVLILGGVLAAAATIVVSNSCSILRALNPEMGARAPKPRLFNHEAHIVRGPACADCHETAEKEIRAGMPEKAFCMNCHEEIDKEKDKPLEKKVAWFEQEGGQIRWADFGKQKPDIKFSHKAHAGKVTCAECHGAMDKNTGLIPTGPQRMASCVDCHREKAPTKMECSTCHVSTDITHRPDNHYQLWTKLHGNCAREGAGVATVNNCSICHQQQSCTLCHQTVPPQDHGEFWRLRGHGVMAGLDRSRCLTCHSSDSCISCHRVTAPISHGAGWNAPQDRHCQSCHLPLQASGGCAVCHRDTPGHAGAPPKPPWHTPVMVCRTCHGTTMKHPDNGDNCNACHR